MPLSLYADRVRETTTTSGTGSVSLAGAVASYQSFASAFTSGQQVAYALWDVSNGGWEVGIGTFTTGSLSRDTVTGSSAAGAHIVLSGNTTQVFNTAPAIFFQTVQQNPWIYDQAGGL